MEPQVKQIGFLGMGKLGLECAEAIAEHYPITGYDIYPRTSDTVTISATLKGAVENKDIIFIAVQTPHDKAYGGEKPVRDLPTKDFDYSLVEKILSDVNKYVNKDQLVVLISTVLPGTTRKHFIDKIPNARFLYNPYLIAMGTTTYDMINPEMVIIGTADGDETTDAKELIDFYRPIMQNDPRYEVGTWDEAEAIKVFYNTMISAKLGIVNMIQDVAQANGNMNVDVVTNALAKSTQRIVSSKYMIAGMGDSGPCHPRDNIALSWLAEELDLGYDIFDTIINAREQQAKHKADFLIALQKEYNLPIVIHGKTYKPDINLTDGSYSLLIGHYLDEANAKYVYADPLTDDIINDGENAIVFLAHNRKITYCYLPDSNEQNLYFIPGNKSIIVDPWRTFNTTTYKVIHYGNTRR